MTGSDRLRRVPYKELGLSQLRSFCEVCRRGSYAEAARVQLLTSPAVWEQVKALERYYGVELFERQGNGVVPTIHGTRLLELVRPVLAGLESARDVLHQRDGALPGQVTVLSNLRVLAEEISRAMAAFRRRYPAVRLFISYTSGPDVEPLVLEGDADVALTLEPGPDEPISPALAYEPAGELDYLLVTPPRHPLSRGAVRLQSIVKYPLVLGEPKAYSRHRVQEIFHRHNLLGQMNISVETSSDEYTPTCVRAGLGIGIAIGSASTGLYRGLGVRPLRKWFGTARVGFLWRRGSHVPPLQREMADLLRLALTNGG
jgi:DNA-binding transcriptional LysR family regulator